jgi:hypothetical protein
MFVEKELEESLKNWTSKARRDLTPSLTFHEKPI